MKPLLRIYFSSAVLLLANLLSSVSSAQMLKVETATNVIFSRTVVGATETGFREEKYSWGWQKLPRHFSASNTGYLHYVGGTERPAGATTQWIAFSFKSSGLFTTNPGSHFAVVGRSESTSWYNRGRGLIIGQAGRGCPSLGAGFATAQPETWFFKNGIPANYVWSGTYCSAKSMKENTRYNVNAHIGTSGMAYTITDATTGETIVSQYVLDDKNEESALINEKLTGYALGLVFADAPGSAWKLTFDNISTGWF